MVVIPTPELVVLFTFPFLVTFVALHFILFRPLLRYLAERHEAVHEARHEAEHLGAETEQHVRTLEDRLNAARDEVAGLRTAARNRAMEREAAIIAAARADADQRLKAAVEEIGREQAQAAIVMRESARALSQDIANRVLGRAAEGT